MPKLWTDTIEAHRAAVRDAALDAAGELIAAHGLTGVTMSRLAATTGIGRATLYKYFPDVDAVLHAWHDRQVEQHLTHLTAVRDRTAPAQRLTAVLTAYAHLARHRHSHSSHDSRDGGTGGDLAATLHRSDHATAAHDRSRARQCAGASVRGSHRARVPVGGAALSPGADAPARLSRRAGPVAASAPSASSTAAPGLRRAAAAPLLLIRNEDPVLAARLDLVHRLVGRSY